jgi:hypothetical protein
VADVVHHFNQLAFILRYSVFNKTKRTLDHVQLIDDLFKGLLDFRAELVVGWTNLLISEEFLLCFSGSGHRAWWLLISSHVRKDLLSFGQLLLGFIFAFLLLFLDFGGKALDVRLVGDEDVGFDFDSCDTVKLLGFSWIQVGVPYHDI